MFGKRKSPKASHLSWQDLSQEYRLVVINASVTIALITVIVTVLLFRAAFLQRETAIESMSNLAGMTAKEIQADYQSYIDRVRSIAYIMENFENTDAAMRRAMYNDVLLGVLLSDRNFIRVYSFWEPDMLDGMDALYANTGETDE
ncbi:MAG: hypothetical protein LBI85_01250, partial [Spirochaetaceae bacterium]|nr:hypothetical protein [Spirochaetaceae bacterium]